MDNPYSISDTPLRDDGKRRRRYPPWYSVVALLLLMLASIPILVSLRYQPRPPIIRLTIPDGFRGPLVVREMQGAIPPKQTSNHQYRIQVPSTGIAVIGKSGLFYQWHTRNIAYASGTSLPDSSSLDQEDETTVAFWGLHTEDNKDHWYFVGTRSEVVDMYTSDLSVKDEAIVVDNPYKSP